MATKTSYLYTKVIIPDQLASEIAVSAIITALDVVILNGTNNVTIWFKDVLSAGDQTILDGLVAAHIPNLVIPTPTTAIASTPTAPVYVYRASEKRATYTASIVGLNPTSTPTDILMITGSATKLITVTRISISATQSTASTRDVVIIKRSSNSTAGTSSTPVAVPHDSTSAAATAVLKSWTGNPTLGTFVGNLYSRKLFIGTTSSTTIDEFLYESGIRNNQGATLRSAAECIVVNLNGVTSSGGSFDISIEWTEE